MDWQRSHANADQIESGRPPLPQIHGAAGGQAKCRIHPGSRVRANDEPLE
jgi:hypothetical protein